ncbi:MAG: MCE family protein [Acidimicrobiales bacterium]
MNRSVLARIVALLVITAAGFYYVAFDAVGIKVADTPYTVHVVLPAGGNLYTDASVTYRGVEVGKVGGLHLHPTDVIADLAIDRGVRIPASASAHVRELTAAGEQYIDLVPAGDQAGRSGTVELTGGTSYLHNGSVIPENRTTIPVSIGELLDTLDSLVNSLHASDLNTISTTIGQGLQGAAYDLRSIFSDSKTLLQALQSAVPGTVQLVDAGNTVLSTFNATSGELARFSKNLDLLSAQVARSNGDLVALLRHGTSASNELTQFLQANGSSTASFIDNLAAVAGVGFQREPAFRALFQVLPLLATNLASTAGNGQIRFELTFNDRNTVCPYTSTMAEPTALVATADLTRNCGMRAPDLLQRGADKAPPPKG